MDRREALKKIAVGGAVVAGTSMISTSPAFAAAPSPGPRPGFPVTSSSNNQKFNVHVGDGAAQDIAPTCSGSPGATWVARLCVDYKRTTGGTTTSLNASCDTDANSPLTLSSGNEWVTPTTPRGSTLSGDWIEMELIVKVTCPGETPVCYQYTETATATVSGNTVTWTNSAPTGPTVVTCPF